MSYDRSGRSVRVAGSWSVALMPAIHTNWPLFVNNTEPFQEAVYFSGNEETMPENSTANCGQTTRGD